MALPAGVAPASIRLEDECLVYFGHGSVRIGVMEQWNNGAIGEMLAASLQNSITPFRKWSARQDLHLRSLGPKPSALLLRYAPIALTAVSSGQEERRTLTLARSCGKI
jgi:hypothetical protein